MRSILLIFSGICLFSCGTDPNQIKIGRDDSAGIDTSSQTELFASVRDAVGTLNFPLHVTVDSFKQFQAVELDELSAIDLLPGDFEYEAYKSVTCFADSRVNRQPILWFRLQAEGAYEEAPLAQYIVAVLYDCNNYPIDVYNVASADLGYSNSYVRSDSIFTVEFDEMENISVTTSALSIYELGFMPAPATTRTFDPDKEYKESRDYANAFLHNHGYSPNVNE